LTQDSMICTLDIQMGDEISYCLCKGSKRPKTLMLNSYLHKPLDRLLYTNEQSTTYLSFRISFRIFCIFFTNPSPK
jgi:hypothetical protein